MSCASRWTRRDVLQILGTSAAAFACGNIRPPPPCVVPGSETSVASYCLVTGEVLRIPNVRPLGVGEATLFNVDDDTAVVIARDAAGLYAMSGICTHQCCLVALCANAACTELGTNPGACNRTATDRPAATGAAIVCPCHGSTFAIDGTVLTGPAIRSLPHYALALDGEDALVDTSRTVAATTRA